MNSSQPSTTPRNALRLRRVMAKTGLSRTSIYRLIQRKKFPAPCKLSERVSAWDEAEVDAWLASRFAGRAT